MNDYLHTLIYFTDSTFNTLNYMTKICEKNIVKLKWVTLLDFYFYE